MDTRQLEVCLSKLGYCKVVPLDGLRTLKPERRPMGIIVNSDRSDRPGEHWVTIFLDHRGHGEFFCSFGLPPLHKYILDFMSMHCRIGWCYNNVTIQEMGETICGNLCVRFLRSRFAGVTFHRFISNNS